MYSNSLLDITYSYTYSLLGVPNGNGNLHSLKSVPVYMNSALLIIGYNLTVLKQHRSSYRYTAIRGVNPMLY